MVGMYRLLEWLHLWNNLSGHYVHIVNLSLVSVHLEWEVWKIPWKMWKAVSWKEMEPTILTFILSFDSFNSTSAKEARRPVGRSFQGSWPWIACFWHMAMESQTVIHLGSLVEMCNDGHDMYSARVAWTQARELECLQRRCWKKRVRRKAQPSFEIYS